MIKKILVGLIVVVAVFAAYVATLPSHFHVERSAVVNAPPVVVFQQVNVLRNWEAWSPWAKMDPAMKQSYEGPAAGVGAVSIWAGNRKVGEGRSTIVESRPNEFFKFSLEFLKPMKASHTSGFTFKPEGKQTAVSWSMEGDNSFLCKAVGVFMNMDKMVGGEFEKGLVSLNSVSEFAAMSTKKKKK